MIDFYIPTECIWYSLCFLYVFICLVFSRKIYAEITGKESDYSVLIALGLTSLVLSVAWPIGLIFYGVKKK